MARLDPGLARKKEELRIRIEEMILASGLELEEFHLAGQHDQASHGSWAGPSEDLSPAMARERESIGKEIQAARIAAGKSPLAPNSLRGYAIKEHQRRVEARGEGGALPRRATAPAKTPAVKTPSATETRISGMKERIAEKTRIESERIKAKQAESIAAIKEAETARIKKAASETTKPSGAIEELKKKAEEAAARAREIGAGAPMSEAHVAAMKEATAAEVAVMNAKTEAARNQPSKVHETAIVKGPLASNVHEGVIEGAEALEKAGLKGNYGDIEVKADERGKTRNGAYYNYMNRIVMNEGLDKGNAAFTFAHEYGHHMDHFESRRTGGQKLSEDLEFRRLMRRTSLWKELSAQSKSKIPDVPQTAYRSTSRAKYLNSWHELFARAVAQWTATRSKNPAMLGVLDKRRADHWPDDEFKTLAAYLDRVLAKK